MTSAPPLHNRYSVCCCAPQFPVSLHGSVSHRTAIQDWDVCALHHYNSLPVQFNIPIVARFAGYKVPLLMVARFTDERLAVAYFTRSTVAFPMPARSPYFISNGHTFRGSASYGLMIQGCTSYGLMIQGCASYGLMIQGCASYGCTTRGCHHRAVIFEVSAS